MRLRLHAAVVHFPVTCWTLSAALELTAAMHRSARLLGVDISAAVLALIWTGFAFAVVAAILGFVEFAKLPADRRITAQANRHIAAIAAASICFLLAGLSLQGIHGFALRPPTLKLLLGLGLVFVILGGHLGGRLVSVCEQALGRAKDNS